MPHAVPPSGVFYRHYGRHDVIQFAIGHLWFGLAAGSLDALLHANLPRAVPLHASLIRCSTS